MTSYDQPEFFDDAVDAAEGESGQGLAEYALILAFVALACIIALGALGDAIAGSDGFKIFDMI